MNRDFTINFKDKNMKKGNFMFKVLLTLIAGIFLSVDAFAQQIAVKGMVKDATGEPVIGANVVVKGTTTGTITDFDGNFQLSAKQGDIIVVSFIGYQPQELPVAAQMNVILKDDTERRYGNTGRSSSHRLRSGEKERYDRFGNGYQAR